MNTFDLKKYLVENRSQEKEINSKIIAQKINKILPEGLGYKEFAMAVAIILKDEYGSHIHGPFMDALQAELS